VLGGDGCHYSRPPNIRQHALAAHDAVSKLYGLC
jgi:hypothetical protein